MRRCAFLTMDDLTGFHTYDDLVHGPLRDLGWAVENVSWRATDDWTRFDLVVIRSTWDYQADPGAFLAALEAIERSSAQLENPLPVVRWNLDKRYLAELEAAAIPIVPTRWRPAGAPLALEGLRDEFGCDELVVKPCVSANADHTFRLGPDADLAPVRAAFRQRDAMVQPFLPGILTDGELSVFHFGGTYSHAVVKVPRAGDFRVQEEHGGRLARAEPEPALLAAADRALAAVPGPLLYARSDFVAHGGRWLLMELEVIEPSLYFNLDPDAPARFAQTIDRWPAVDTPRKAP